MLQLFREHWPRKQKTLFFINADLVEELVLAFGLYTLGNHPEFECFCRCNDSAYQRL